MPLSSVVILGKAKDPRLAFDFALACSFVIPARDLPLPLLCVRFLFSPKPVPASCRRPATLAPNLGLHPRETPSCRAPSSPHSSSASAPPSLSPQSPRHPTHAHAEPALTPREQSLQLLNRFTFGPRPGDLEHVLAITPEAWLDSQLDPDHLPENPVLTKRLAALPTLSMQPAEALAIFPDRQIIKRIAEDKQPYPADPELAAVYQVQVIKYLRSVDRKQNKPDPDAETDTEKKSAGQRARDIAGQLLVLPAPERMPALLRLPVDDRIAFARHVPPDQRTAFLAGLTPREHELFLTLASNVNASGQIVAELQGGKLLRDILSERQLLEVMTDFWFNHFNVDARKQSDQWYTTSYERDAIRAHALGHFPDLLVATATSPAMMVYLDNWLSTGPDSAAAGNTRPNAKPAAKRNSKGLNENYGREIMELHTLSVNGGYTQADVTALANILTGWTVDKPQQGGPFLFDPRRHEPGPKQWLGHTLSNPSDGMAEGREALTILAKSPQTARFISYLLAQRFVADTPPPTLVDHLTSTYLDTGGDIRALLRTLAHSPEFNARTNFDTKVKTPLEFVASTFRATATDPANPAALANTLRDMGMPLFQQQPPTGYLLTADHWMNSAALVDRLNFADTLTGGRYPNQPFDSPRLLADSLLSQPKAAPSRTMSRQVSLPTTPSPTSPGTPAALHLLEATLLAAPVNARTDQLIQAKAAELTTPTSTPTDTLNLFTALILGSPDFQLH